MSASDVKLVFGDAVRKQRSTLGISQEELSDRSGLHRTYISDVERGARNLSLESIEKLAKALKLSVSTLFARAANDGISEQLVDILLVEDNPHDVELTLRAFRKAHFKNNVRVARDGEEAIEFLRPDGGGRRKKIQPLPGVILLDLNLPKVDGIEVLRRIKASDRTKEIPVIVLTVSSRNRDISECRRMGVESYIVKPIGFQNFSEMMPGLHFDWALLKRRG